MVDVKCIKPQENEQMAQVTAITLMQSKASSRLSRGLLMHFQNDVLFCASKITFRISQSTIAIVKIIRRMIVGL